MASSVLASTTSLIDLVNHDWKKIDLPKLRSELDEKVEDMYTKSEASMEHRKKLGQLTRELKAADSESKLRQLGAVIKAYQKHIDCEFARYQSMEGAFLSVYKVVTDAPDPVDALNEAQTQMLKAQRAILEADEMREKLESYEREFNALKNQEITVRKLEAQLKHSGEDIDTRVADAVTKEAKRLSDEYEQVIAQMRQSEVALETEMQQLRREQVATQKTLSAAQNELFSHSLEKEETAAVEESARDMLEEDLERANAAVMELQKKNSDLSTEMRSLKREIRHSAVSSLSSDAAMDLTLDSGDPHELQRQLNSARKRLSDQMQVSQSLRKKCSGIQETAEKKAAEARHETERLLAEKQRQKEVLAQLPSVTEYSALKKKVSALQKSFLVSSDIGSVSAEWYPSELGVYRTHIAEATDNGADDTSTSMEVRRAADGGSEELDAELSAELHLPIETLFYQKRRKMESEISKLRMDLYARSDKLNALQLESEKLKEQCAEKDDLVCKLETDLARFLKPAIDSSASVGFVGFGDGSQKMQGGKSHEFELRKDGKQERDESSAMALAPLSGDSEDIDDNWANTSGGVQHEAEALAAVMQRVNLEKKAAAMSGYFQDEELDTDAMNDTLAIADESSDAAALKKRGVAIRPVRRSPLYKGDDYATTAGSSKVDNSAFTIVCRQRDRFRERTQELEKKVIAMETGMRKLQIASRNLKKENLELYKKIRFLEDYKRAAAGGSGLQQAAAGRRSMLGAYKYDIEAADVEEKYGELYEEHMNPFQKFRQIEKQRRIENLQWTEWVAYFVGSIVLGRRTLRVFAVFYAIALHLLTFFSLYHEIKSHGFSHPDCLTQASANSLPQLVAPEPNDVFNQ